jgi:hypothetical protein
MGRYIQAHWQELVSGKDVDMRFGVPERRETVGFKIFKEKETKMDGHDVIVAKMKPTSLADELYYRGARQAALLLL